MSGEDIIELEKGYARVFKDGIQVPTNQLLPLHLLALSLSVIGLLMVMMVMVLLAVH
jgi:hypothetical protein